MTVHSNSFANRTILLVEDEPFVRDATSRILENAGFRVLAATDAQEALATLDQHAIDLLMTDIVLPGRSGFQLVNDLRLRSSTTSVLLTSGYGETAAQCENSGMYYLAKPYSRQSLLEKLEQVFNAGAFENVASAS